MVEMSCFVHQLLRRFGVALGIEISRLRGRYLRLLIEALGLEIGLEIYPVGLGDGELALRFERLELDVRIAELEQYSLGLDFLPRLGQSALDSAGGYGGDVADALWHQRPGTPHLDHQRALLHRVDPDGRAIHPRRRRLETAEAERRGDQRDQGDGAVEDSLATAIDRCTGYVHATILSER